MNGRTMRTVVWNLTGMARPNEIVGLIGPTASGKTVLLNIFSDRLHPPTGGVYKRNVYVNRHVPLTRDLFGKIGAYVMQDDVLLETLTPLESVQFSASLRLSGTKEEKNRRVDKVIDDLKLQTCKNTLVLSPVMEPPLGRERAEEGNIGRGEEADLDRRGDRDGPCANHPRWYDLVRPPARADLGPGLVHCVYDREGDEGHLAEGENSDRHRKPAEHRYL